MSQAEDINSNSAESSIADKEPKRKWRGWNCCTLKGIYSKTLSVGLTVGLYLFFGGAIFSFLERPVENAKNQDVANTSSTLARVEDQIVSLLTTETPLNDSSAESLVDMLKQLTLQNSTSTTENWDYGSSVFFCTTVITTIGTVLM